MSSGSGNTIAASQYAKAINSKSANHAHYSKKWAPAGLIKVNTAIVKKEKKMGWFKRKFNSWVRQAWEDARTEPVDSDVIRTHDGVNGKTSIKFTVYPASGGFVIESYKQDRYKDSEGPTLTIVNHSEELGKAVEHIIAIEALRA